MSQVLWDAAQKYTYSLFPKVSEAQYPEFDPNPAVSRFDQRTFGGRVRHFYSVLDPLTLLVPESVLGESRCKVEDFIAFRTSQKTDAAKFSKYSNAELWEAKRLLQAAKHPDTGETIEWPFRFSAFSLFNMPICLMLLWPSKSPLITATSQFVNQSYNTAVNYKNRSAAGGMSDRTLFLSYASAVTVSISMAVGLKSAVFKSKRMAPLMVSNSFIGAFTRGFVPYTALVIANCMNVLMIRWDELFEGVPVSISRRELSRLNAKSRKSESGANLRALNQVEEDGDELLTVGHSVSAGRDALFKCCVARVVWNIPPMIFPPLIMRTVFHPRMWWRTVPKWKKLVTETLVIGATLLTFIPPSQAIYPQQVAMKASLLEEDISKALAVLSPETDPQTLADTLLLYNKGL